MPRRYAFSFVSAPLPKAATVAGPWAFASDAIRSAMKSYAVFQATGASVPSAFRSMGFWTRSGWSRSAAEVNPLMHIWPRFTGKSSSARTWTSRRSAPDVVTAMPHWNAQYGQ